MPDRRRKKNPRKHQLCLRLNDREKELLEIYTEVRDHPSEVAAVRHMINGLENWLAKHLRATEERSSADPDRSAATSHQSEAASHQSQPRPPTGNSGLSSPGDVSITDVDISDGEVGDFGGRPKIGLPNPAWHEDD